MRPSALWNNVILTCAVVTAVSMFFMGIRAQEAIKLLEQIAKCTCGE